jgi:hypothetical protein
MDAARAALGVLVRFALSLPPRLLEDLVQTAEHKLHHLPKFAVVAVPSYFDQRGKGWALQAAQDGTGLVGAGAVEVVEDSPHN